MDVSRIREYIAEHIKPQPGTKIQYGHPSPRFWKPVDMTAERIASMRQPDRKLFLYLHIPFCPKTDPPACGFCLFAREDFSGYPAVENYLEYLRRELEFYRPTFGGQVLEAVYFGGGTPNVLKPRDYHRIMDCVRSVFRIAPGAEVSLEGVPQLFGDDRLEAMAQAGVTRVSVGAQQLKDDLLKYSGRQNTADDVFRAIDRAHELGMVVNVDLICGWFDQTESDLEDDLAALMPHRPESIVVHPLTLQGPSHFAQESAKLPSVAETCATFLRGRKYLEANGYWGSSYTDYMLKNPPRGPEEVAYLRYYREILKYDRLGVGYGANSLFAGAPGTPSMTWRNIDETGKYYERIDQGGLPSLEGFTFEPIDLRLLYVLSGLAGTPFLTAAAYARDWGRDLGSDFGDYWTVLRERGWLEIHGDEYRIVGEGVFYLPMIQRCISNDRNDELRAASPKQRRNLPQIHPV